jgi:hypothetical protein
MHRFLIAITVGCLYTAGTVWLVRHEGESYRSMVLGTKEGPRSKKPPSRDAADTTSSPPVLPKSGGESQRSSTVSKPESVPSPIERDPAPVTPPTQVVIAPAPAPAVVAPIPDTKPALTRDPIWNSEAVTKSWDVMQLKTEDVDQIGADLHELIMKYNRETDNDVLQLRVNQVLQRLRSQFAPKSGRFGITILESDAANAFSHPGGYIYISRGLLELIGADRDYALEFAIGHEMAHLELHHAILCLRDPGVSKRKGGTVEKLYTLIIPNGYFDDPAGGVNQEFQADEWIYTRMKRLEPLHRTDRECFVFLYILEDYAKAKDFASGNKTPRPSREHSILENHYRAHLATRDRLDHLKKFRDELSSRKK